MNYNILTTTFFFCSVVVTESVVHPIVDQIKDFKSWNGRSSCKRITTIFDIQKRFAWQLSHLAGNKNKMKDLLDPQVKTLHLFLKELNDTKFAIFSSFNFLIKLLREDYKSVRDVKEGIESRIVYFQNEIGREQELFNEILKAEKELDAIIKEKEKQNDTSHSHASKMQKYVEEVLSDVSLAADKLENSLEENAYSKQAGGAYEVVLRVNENEEGDILDNSKSNISELLSDQTKYVMTTVIDSSSNHYVLSKPNDPTLPHEDRHLIQNIICITIVSFLFALVCNSFHMPTMFGFVVAGMILGPPGLNIIQVWKVAIYGSTFIMITVIACGIVWGLFFGIPTRPSSFVAACLCLSSTPLVAKFISSSERAPLDGQKYHTNGDDYAGPLLGILIMQDVHLGFLIAILPALAGHHGTRSARVIKSGLIHDMLHGIRHSEETAPAGWLIVELVLALLGVLIFGYFIAKYLLSKFFRFLQTREDGYLELLTLGVLAFCFVFLQLTEILGISMELGCFMAGTVISSQGEVVTLKLNTLLEPIKDVFSCIFFASIGLHVFPTFLYDQLALIVTLTLGVVIIKFVVASSVLRLLMVETKNVRFIIAAGLAQVSEFSFVLGSRARRLGLITREIYLIILSVTSLSLFIAPLLWKVALWRYAGRRIHAPYILVKIITILFNKLVQLFPM